MFLEKAIWTAMTYDDKVRNTYLVNIDSIADESGCRGFNILGDEEQEHLKTGIKSKNKDKRQW